MSERSNEHVNLFPKHYSLLLNCVDLNKKLPQNDLVKLTWGNASIRKDNLIAIKPSGVPFEKLYPSNISLIEIYSEKLLLGNKPSVDTPIHLELYKSFPEIGSIIHTHSTYATSWAQSQLEIPCYGTTHADHFIGPVPITRILTKEELEKDYERNIGKVIVEHYKENNIDPLTTPGILLPFHGAVVFGITPEKTLENAIALEEIAKIAINTIHLKKVFNSDGKELFQKHFERKHGNKKYYGQ